MSLQQMHRSTRADAGAIPARLSPDYACFVLMGLAFVYWTFVALYWRSITTDPGISILAAQSILEHGYPLLPSGFLYYRAQVANYLLAASMYLFGFNDLGVALSSILLGLGSLYCTYAIARDALNRPWLGIGAVAVLILLSVNTYHAASPRMYMPLQFFSLLAIWACWRGWADSDTRFIVIGPLAAVAAFYTHYLSGSLALAIPCALLAIGWLERRSIPRGRRLALVLVLGALLLMFAVMIVMPAPENALPTIALGGGEAGGLSGLNLNPRRWLSQLNWLEQAVPLGLLLFPALVWMLIDGFRRPSDPVQRGRVYLLLVFAGWVAGILGYVRVSGTRLWVGILPVYVLLLLVALSDTRNAFRELPAKARRSLVSQFTAWGVIVLAGYSSYYGTLAYPSLVLAGYGPPCRHLTDACSRATEAQYDRLRPNIAEGDVVISSSPFAPYYYLGKIDGWLIQKIQGSGYTSFEEERDEYFGIQLIDTEPELRELAAASHATWVIVQSEPDLDETMKRRVAELFQVWDTLGPVTVYRNRATR